MAQAMYDVIVVGSGATGGWAAKRLAEAGVNLPSTYRGLR
jgi:choline dehydrogenase-like flavoprotein